MPIEDRRRTSASTVDRRPSSWAVSLRIESPFLTLGSLNSKQFRFKRNIKVQELSVNTVQVDIRSDGFESSTERFVQIVGVFDLFLWVICDIVNGASAANVIVSCVFFRFCIESSQFLQFFGDLDTIFLN